MAKSTNKTSAAIERLARHGDVLISGYAFGWEVRVYKLEPTMDPQGSIAFTSEPTLDQALNAALRKLEGSEDGEGL